MPARPPAATMPTSHGGVHHKGAMIAAALVLLVLLLLRQWWALCADHPQQAQPRMLRGTQPLPVDVLRGGAKLRARVLTYNTMLLPTPAAPNITGRARAIGGALGAAVRNGAAHVVALQEAVDPGATRELLLAADFPWWESPLTPPQAMRMNGGVLLAAREPPFVVRTHIFQARAPASLSWDGLICKGIVHCGWRLPHGGGELHVYASHTQSPSEEQAVREAQIVEWRVFIAAYGHPARGNHTVLLCGDFNCHLDDPTQLAALGVEAPSWAPVTLADGAHARATWDAWAPQPTALLDGVLVYKPVAYAGQRNSNTQVLRVGAQSDHNAVLTEVALRPA